eukprot:Gregarina_sp_Pseudo_9__685@NODE_1436_length_1604_cov_6_517572_g1333_i0_p1_GENE_NODE_1436_length_1604_cov_6_517572_g1333_i0NODE_1436_length_1604_cov_6_517572_g1333_i0_p1_ORF_typecomplete_len524_score79_69Sas10/PF09368_10/5_1e18_NODE_1436_length_1604_cov_6_517572_g1333_i071578
MARKGKKKVKESSAGLPTLANFDLSQAEREDEELRTLQAELAADIAAEEEEDAELTRLQEEHIYAKPAVDSSDAGEDYEDQLQAEFGAEEESRDAWGRKTQNFYVDESEMSSESDDADEEDDDEFEQQLEEARAIREKHLSTLSLRELNAGLEDFLGHAGASESGATSGLTDDSVALQMLLSSNMPQKKSSLVESSLDAGKLMKEIVSVYRNLCSDVEQESQAYLRCRLGQVPVPKLTEGAIAFLDLQLRLCLWFTAVLQTCEVFGKDLPPTVLSMARLVIKATKKLRKLRKQFGEENLAKLRKTLRTLSSDMFCSAKATSLKDTEETYEQECSEDDGTVTHSDSAEPESANLTRAEQARQMLEERRKQTMAKQLRSFKDLAEQTTDDDVEPNSDQGMSDFESDEIDPRNQTSIANQEREGNKTKTTEKVMKEGTSKRTQLPSLPREVEGPREITREIEKNRGLTRKRKKYEGHARVHNRVKYARKLKKLSGVTRKADFGQAENYSGEASGIASYFKKKKKLS